MAQLSFAKREALAVLLAAGAIDRATARTVLDEPGLKQVVVGALRRVALVDSRTVRTLSGIRTAYWLTGAGLMKARQLAEA